MAQPFEQLDYVYVPSRDVAADVAGFVDRLGGRLVFAVEAMGTRVAMVELTEGPPRVVLADHLTGDRPVFVYRVDDFESSLAAIEARGLSRDRTLEIPQGPCCTFELAGGHRVAIYERTRPDVEASFEGRRDF